MEKILKILIGVVLAILLFIWISSTYKSCGKSNGEVTVTETQQNTSDEGDFDEDFFDPETNVAEEKAEDAIGEVVEEPVTDYTEVDEIIEQKKTDPKPKPVYKAKPLPKKPVANSGYSDGRYLIVAGTYLVKDNANKMLNKLSRLGYNRSEMVKFDNSQYHTVIARRFSDYNEALEISAQLKRKGIDNYVHKRVD